MKRTTRLYATILATGAAAAFSLTTLTGCGGGATEKPTVTVKPAESGDGGGAEDGGGTENGGAEVVAEGFGGVKGKVTFQGDAPTLAVLVKQGDASVKDAEVCAAQSVPNQRIVVGENGGVANVFVYLPKAPKGAEVPPVPEEPAVFDQKGCLFLPHGLLLRCEQTLLIKSDDPIAHNTHTYPARNDVFNTGIKPNDRDGVPTSYARPEPSPFQVKCDFHTWMIAYHLPLDHPFAAVTDENGEFEIADLPAGEHEFRVWHEGIPGSGFLERSLKVTVKADATETVDIEYPASKFQANAQQNIKTIKLSALLND